MWHAEASAMMNVWLQCQNCYGCQLAWTDALGPHLPDLTPSLVNAPAPAKVTRYLRRDHQIVELDAQEHGDYHRVLAEEAEEEEEEEEVGFEESEPAEVHSARHSAGEQRKPKAAADDVAKETAKKELGTCSWKESVSQLCAKAVGGRAKQRKRRQQACRLNVHTSLRAAEKFTAPPKQTCSCGVATAVLATLMVTFARFGNLTNSFARLEIDATDAAGSLRLAAFGAPGRTDHGSCLEEYVGSLKFAEHDHEGIKDKEMDDDATGVEETHGFGETDHVSANDKEMDDDDTGVEKTHGIGETDHVCAKDEEMEEWSDEDIEDLFADIDANGDGYAGYQELRAKYGDDDAASKVLEVDANADGRLSHDEFWKFLSGEGMQGDNEQGH